MIIDSVVASRIRPPHLATFKTSRPRKDPAMCGRFALYSPYPTLSDSLHLPLEAGEVTPGYNVATGTFIMAVRHADDEAPLVLDELWWGYRPHWAE
ncbi:SOS response-associated peptidase family protein [Halomonas sp. TRM85114]|nr:SOS response-associated peptidase family protein [Halomonas jincaotanensis]MBS9405696.1 SOS response-associated peptidase family protein [Halomonas jincaotanensis]